MPQWTVPLLDRVHHLKSGNQFAGRVDPNVEVAVGKLGDPGRETLSRSVKDVERGRKAPGKPPAHVRPRGGCRAQGRGLARSAACQSHRTGARSCGLEEILAANGLSGHGGLVAVELRRACYLTFPARSRKPVSPERASREARRGRSLPVRALHLLDLSQLARQSVLVGRGDFRHGERACAVRTPGP